MQAKTYTTISSGMFYDYDWLSTDEDYRTIYQPNAETWQKK